MAKTIVYTGPGPDQIKVAGYPFILGQATRIDNDTLAERILAKTGFTLQKTSRKKPEETEE